ncbi:hypothetical protein ACFX13_044319 [Malus domestica]
MKRSPEARGVHPQSSWPNGVREMLLRGCQVGRGVVLLHQRKQRQLLLPSTAVRASSSASLSPRGVILAFLCRENNNSKMILQHLMWIAF